MLARCIRFLATIFITFAAYPHAATQASGGSEIGQELFESCARCHTLRPGEHKVGPTLVDLFGREAGTQEGYRYSGVLRDSGIVWDDTSLDAFLANPRSFLPGSRMSFRGIDDDHDRQDLIDWLREATAGADAAMGAHDTMSEMMTDMMDDPDHVMDMADGMAMMPGSTRLVMPPMDSELGKGLFVTKGCVACHAVNGVGGHDAAALDAHAMMPVMNPFDFAAKMWRVAPLMIGAQEDALGGQILFSGEELGHIVAFVHDDEAQHDFSESDLTDDAIKLMEHSHDGATGSESHSDEIGHVGDDEHDQDDP